MVLQGAVSAVCVPVILVLICVCCAWRCMPSHSECSEVCSDEPASSFLARSSISSQRGVVEKSNKVAAPAAAKIINQKKSDEANITTSPTSTPRGQTKTFADFRNLQNLFITQGYAFYINISLRRSVKLGECLSVVEKSKTTSDPKSPDAVSPPHTELHREPLDLVLVSGTAEVNDKAKMTRALKRASARKDRAAPSARTRVLIHASLLPSSNEFSQRPTHNEAKSVIHRKRSETTSVYDFGYRRQ
ncbi:hypothetical protein EVAR_66887_1 [Eumeta japonica]|uniref:Uncharacterized protein n=1 Tax=Eumeta variegata TaxID=151549 RepID=A0A4C1ZMZ1_EUMVA|nr:hypothetical protein EVAR_66887_1 [Eumeta japonica]